MTGHRAIYVWPLVACAALAAVIWAGTFIVVEQLRKATENEAAAVRHNLANSLAEREASSVRAIDISLVALRDVWLRDRGGFEGAVRQHEELLRKERVIQVAVVDAEGWLVYSRLPVAQPPMQFADRSYFKAQRESAADRLHISEPVLGRVTREWAIQFTRPIRGPDGRFAGVIVVAVPPPALEHVYREIDLGPGGVITLARSDGQVLARSTELDRVPVDGIARLVAQREVPEYQLVIFVGQSVGTVMEPYERQRGYLLVFASAATVLLLCVGLLLALRARDRVRYRDERERMMLELHDGCIQAIYAIGLTLQGTRRLLQEAPDRANALIAQAEADLNLVIQDLRAFIGAEKPPQLTAAQLRAEIERSLPQTPLTRFEVELEPRALEALAAEEASHIVRIVREAAANVARHAGATQAFVRLNRTGDGRFELEIADNGRGLGAAASRSGLGLAHIEARARKLGGRARFTTAGNGGTRVSVRFPEAT